MFLPDMKKDEKTNEKTNEEVMPDDADKQSVVSAAEEVEGLEGDISVEEADSGKKGMDTFSRMKAAAGKKLKKKSAKVDKSGMGEAEVKEPLADQLLRLRADFDNFRKRTLRERNELYQRANEDLMEEIMPVLDHLDLALQAADDHGADESFVHGVKLVAEQLQTVLGRFGLNPIDSAGADFDHNIHEAVSIMPSETVSADKVIVQVRKGYFLGNRLLRPAQVVVSGGKAGAAPEVDAVEGGE